MALLYSPCHYSMKLASNYLRSLGLDCCNLIYSSLAYLAQLAPNQILANSSIYHIALVGLFSNKFTAIATCFDFIIFSFKWMLCTVVLLTPLM